MEDGQEGPLYSGQVTETGSEELGRAGKRVFQAGGRAYAKALRWERREPKSTWLGGQHSRDTGELGHVWAGYRLYAALHATRTSWPLF